MSTSQPYVYLISSDRPDGLVKIGVSAKPRVQLDGIRDEAARDLPGEVFDIAAVAPGGQTLEKRLHDLFSECHVEDGWFERTRSLNQIIWYLQLLYPVDEVLGPNDPAQEIKAFRATLKGFLEESGIDPTSLGQLAMGDTHFVHDALGSRKPRAAARQRMIKFIDDWRTKKETGK